MTKYKLAKQLVKVILYEKDKTYRFFYKKEAESNIQPHTAICLFYSKMVPTARLELATYALRVRCTTNCAMSAIAQLSYHTFEKSTQIS